MSEREQIEAIRKWLGSRPELAGGAPGAVLAGRTLLAALDAANATCSVLVGRVSILGSANRSLQARLDAANARADNAVEASHLDAADMRLAIRQRGEQKARADEAEREVARLRNPDESSLARAEGVLNVAMMRLQGEHPADTYTGDGYGVWLRSVVASIGAALTPEDTQ